MKITKQYDFKGTLIQYIEGNRFMPIDEKNSDFQIIKAAISSGTCVIHDPEFRSATETVDANGKWTGWDLDVFPHWVPLDQNNSLFKLVESQIHAGTCVRLPPSPKAATERPENLVFAITLAEPWPHLDGRYFSQLTYYSHRAATGLPLQFTILNLPEIRRGRSFQYANEEAIWSVAGKLFQFLLPQYNAAFSK